MDQDVEPEERADPAVAAFEALRREVALLNVAIAGLAAERAAAPDYNETLGEIAKGVSLAVGRLGKILVSPALAMSPTEVAQRIAAAGEAARRQDRAALHQAQERFARATNDLERWIDGARLATNQNRRLGQIACAGIVTGLLLGAWLPGAVARVAPERWAWPEKMAAHVLRMAPWPAGERMLAVADPMRWRAMRAARSDRLALGDCAAGLSLETAARPRPSHMRAHVRPPVR